MKLGGSVLTDKSRYRAPRLDVLARLAGEIARSGERVVLVHGAGSYGHVIAKERNLAQGADGSAAQRMAAAQVHADVRELQGLVLQALRDAGLPAMSLSAYDLARLRAGEISNFASEPVHETLAAGFTPVMGGDVVLDAARGFSILSGDVLMVELARSVRPARAIFVTDVDGIYTAAPDEPGATLLRRIEPERDMRETATRGHDITGGMAGKLRRARDVARAGVPVQIVNGMAPGRLAHALLGDDVVGTLVLP